MAEREARFLESAPRAALYIALAALALAVVEGGVLGAAVLQLRHESPRVSRERAEEPVARSTIAAPPPAPLVPTIGVPAVLTDSDVTDIFRDTLERDPTPNELRRYSGQRAERITIQAVLAHTVEARTKMDAIYRSYFGMPLYVSCDDELAHLLARTSMQTVRQRIAADASGTPRGFASACGVKRAR